MTEDEIAELLHAARAQAWWEGYVTRYDWNNCPDPDWDDNPYMRAEDDD